MRPSYIALAFALAMGAVTAVSSEPAKGNYAEFCAYPSSVSDVGADCNYDSMEECRRGESDSPNKFCARNHFHEAPRYSQNHQVPAYGPSAPTISGDQQVPYYGSVAPQDTRLSNNDGAIPINRTINHICSNNSLPNMPQGGEFCVPNRDGINCYKKCN